MLFMAYINSAGLLRKMVHGTLNFYLCNFCSHLFSTHEMLFPCLSINWFYLWFKGLLKLHLSHEIFSDHHNLKRYLLPLYTIDSLWHLLNIYGLLPGKITFCYYMWMWTCWTLPNETAKTCKKNNILQFLCVCHRAIVLYLLSSRSQRDVYCVATEA